MVDCVYLTDTNSNSTRCESFFQKAYEPDMASSILSWLNPETHKGLSSMEHLSINWISKIPVDGKHDIIIMCISYPNRLIFSHGNHWHNWLLALPWHRLLNVEELSWKELSQNALHRIVQWISAVCYPCKHFGLQRLKKIGHVLYRLPLLLKKVSMPLNKNM